MSAPSRGVLTCRLLLLVSVSSAGCVCVSPRDGLRPLPVAERAAPRCPPDMAAIPGGTYRMGEMGNLVTIEPICLDRDEVTVEAYARCRSCTPPKSHEPWVGSFQPEAYGCNWQRPGAAQHPVNCVDWEQAGAYCAWNHRRLPTEAEWEWAARGGDDARPYPWGSASPSTQLCWPGTSDAQPGHHTTCAIRSYPHGIGRWDVNDLAGNVWEWTSSIYQDEVAPGVTFYVVRGGGWEATDPALMKVAFRSREESTAQLPYNGIRCAR